MSQHVITSFSLIFFNGVTNSYSITPINKKTVSPSAFVQQKGLLGPLHWHCLGISWTTETTNTRGHYLLRRNEGLKSTNVTELLVVIIKLSAGPTPILFIRAHFSDKPPLHFIFPTILKVINHARNLFLLPPVNGILTQRRNLRFIN